MELTDKLTLQCPACAYTGAAREFVPPKLSSRFAETAFPLLLFIVTVALLKWLRLVP